MQALSSAEHWKPALGTLGELTQASFDRAKAVVGSLAELRARAADQAAARPFAKALRGPTVRVIAEVKRASPSKGPIAAGLDAAKQALSYVDGGASAISVLTEPTRFGGSLDDLAEVAAQVAVPVIRKDFIVAPVQLWEARAAGASAALLIVRALAPDLLIRLVACAEEAGLALLIEVRDESELARAIDVGATVVGVNNRNLETLIIDPSTAPRVIRLIPPGCIAVAESGMSRIEDVYPAAEAGADAILVGSAVSGAANPSQAVATLTVVPRRTR